MIVTRFAWIAHKFLPNRDRSIQNAARQHSSRGAQCVKKVARR